MVPFPFSTEQLTASKTRARIFLVRWNFHYFTLVEVIEKQMHNKIVESSCKGFLWTMRKAFYCRRVRRCLPGPKIPFHKKNFNGKCQKKVPISGHLKPFDKKCQVIEMVHTSTAVTAVTIPCVHFCINKLTQEI